MGSPINMVAVNGSKKAINLITKQIKSRLSEPGALQQTNYM